MKAQAGPLSTTTPHGRNDANIGIWAARSAAGSPPSASLAPFTEQAFRAMHMARSLPMMGCLPIVVAVAVLDDRWHQYTEERPQYCATDEETRYCPTPATSKRVLLCQ